MDAPAGASSNTECKGSDVADKELLRTVQRIELRADRILITIREDDTADPDKREEQDRRADLDSDSLATIDVSWTPPSSHPKRDIILPVAAASGSEIKPLRNEERLKLLRAIVTARSFRDALLPIPQGNIDTIALRRGKTERWVRKHLTLAFLDPKLVEAAVDGLLPRGYGLSRFFDLPSDWEAQWRVLDLNNPRNPGFTQGR
jgi:hypothetical protein